MSNIEQQCRKASQERTRRFLDSHNAIYGWERAGTGALRWVIHTSAGVQKLKGLLPDCLISPTNRAEEYVVQVQIAHLRPDPQALAVARRLRTLIPIHRDAPEILVADSTILVKVNTSKRLIDALEVEGWVMGEASRHPGYLEYRENLNSLPINDGSFADALNEWAVNNLVDLKVVPGNALNHVMSTQYGSDHDCKRLQERLKPYGITVSPGQGRMHFTTQLLQVVGGEIALGSITYRMVGLPPGILLVKLGDSRYWATTVDAKDSMPEAIKDLESHGFQVETRTARWATFNTTSLETEEAAARHVQKLITDMVQPEWGTPRNRGTSGVTIRLADDVTPDLLKARMRLDASAFVCQVWQHGREVTVTPSVIFTADADPQLKEMATSLALIMRAHGVIVSFHCAVVGGSLVLLDTHYLFKQVMKLIGDRSNFSVLRMGGTMTVYHGERERLVPVPARFLEQVRDSHDPAHVLYQEAARLLAAG